MGGYSRYAVYFAPQGGWADWATAWLGWDVRTGAPVAHPDLAGLPMEISDLTATPRRYGLHATLKPPFPLAYGATRGALEQAFAAFCASRRAVDLPGLRLTQMHGFLALVPDGDAAPVAALAADVVESFDVFRAPPSEDELARRRGRGLSPRREELLHEWGTPFVMEAFRFHITLTGKLPPDIAARTLPVLESALAPMLPRPLPVDALGLLGEDRDGRFHLLRHAALTG